MSQRIFKCQFGISEQSSIWFRGQIHDPSGAVRFADTLHRTTNLVQCFWLSETWDCPWSPGLSMNKKDLYQDISKEHKYVQGSQHTSPHVHSIQKANKNLFRCLIHWLYRVKVFQTQSAVVLHPQVAFIWRQLTFKTDNLAKNSESRTFQNWFGRVQ